MSEFQDCTIIDGFVDAKDAYLSALLMIIVHYIVLLAVLVLFQWNPMRRRSGKMLICLAKSKASK